MADDFQQRIADILRETGASQADLVEVAGVSKGLVSQWVGGAGKSMSCRAAERINKRYGYAIRWLMTGEGPKMAPSQRAHGAEISNADPEPIEPRFEHDPPVIGTAQLGADGYWHAVDYPVGHGEGFVRYPTRDTNAYALRVKGDSMRPRIKPGEFVLIEPNTPTRPGDEVMVQTKDGQCMIKVLDFRRDGMIQLSSVNEDHRPLTFEETQIEKVHHVGGIVKASLYYPSMS